MSPTPENEDVDTERSTSPSSEKKDKAASTSLSSKPAAKRRTKTGCLTCRKRRIKCGEEKPFCKNCIKSKRECAGYVQPLVYKQHTQGPYPPGHDGTERGSFGDHEQFQFNAIIDVNPSQPGLFNPFAYPSYHEDAHARHDVVSSSRGYHYPPPDANIPFILQSPLGSTEGYRRHSMHQIPSQYPSGIPELQVNVHRDGLPWSARSQQSSISDSATFSYSEPQSDLTSPHDVYQQPFTGGPGYFPYDPAPLHDLRPRRYSIHGFVQTAPFEAVIPTLANPQIPGLPKTGDYDDSDTYADIKMEETSDFEEGDIGREQQFVELLGRHTHRVTQASKQHTKSRALRTTSHSIPASPLQDERNERIFCHFVEVTARCMSIFERQPPDSWSLPPRTLWSYTLPSAAITQPALAHALLALGGLHVAKLQQTSEDLPLKHFTYALRRVSNLLSLPKRRHEITTLATVLLLGFYEVLASDHSRWNLHLTGATKLVIEHDYAAMTRSARAMRNRAKENIMNFPRRSVLTGEDYLAVAGIPESLLDDEDWEVDQTLISNFTGKQVDYDHQIQPNFTDDSLLLEMNEKDVADFKIKMDLRWWYCKQDVFQSMISGDPLLMDYTHWIFCPPRGRIGNASIPHATFDHLLLILARLADFGGRDRSRKQRAVASQGGQWRPPPGLFPSGPPAGGLQSHGGAVGEPGSGTVSKKSPEVSANSEGQLKSKSSATPSANEGRVRQSKQATPNQAAQEAGPSFYGTMPPPPVPPKMHSSFHVMSQQLHGKQSRSRAPDKNDQTARPDLKIETELALAEHAAIGKALEMFASSLSPDFNPILNDGSFPQTSPFGTPMRFQSPAIATIWLHYYVSKILWHRLHPHMPPAAMVSASVTAHLTKEAAQTTGKIAAGLYAMSLGNTGDVLDPVYAGALIESTFPLLFAAIQYQEASQRGWTISKLHDIARMTGWQTSAAVAAACEIAWERMGLAGKGPPYVRSLDRDNKDARVNGASRRVDARGVEVSYAQQDPSEEAESQVFSHDRSLIGKNRQTRVHWALGLLSVEEDIKNLNIGK